MALVGGELIQSGGFVLGEIEKKCQFELGNHVTPTAGGSRLYLLVNRRRSKIINNKDVSWSTTRNRRIVLCLFYFVVGMGIGDWWMDYRTGSVCSRYQSVRRRGKEEDLGDNTTTEGRRRTISTRRGGRRR